MCSTGCRDVTRPPPISFPIASSAGKRHETEKDSMDTSLFGFIRLLACTTMLDYTQFFRHSRKRAARIHRCVCSVLYTHYSTNRKKLRFFSAYRTSSLFIKMNHPMMRYGARMKVHHMRWGVKRHHATMPHRRKSNKWACRNA